jgi:hypothetical protein
MRLSPSLLTRVLIPALSAVIVVGGVALAPSAFADDPSGTVIVASGTSAFPAPLSILGASADGVVYHGLVFDCEVRLTGAASSSPCFGGEAWPDVDGDFMVAVDPDNTISYATMSDPTGSTGPTLGDNAQLQAAAPDGWIYSTFDADTGNATGIEHVRASDDTTTSMGIPSDLITLLGASSSSAGLALEYLDSAYEVHYAYEAFASPGTWTQLNVSASYYGLLALDNSDLLTSDQQDDLALVPLNGAAPAVIAPPASFNADSGALDSAALTTSSIGIVTQDASGSATAWTRARSGGSWTALGGSLGADVSNGDGVGVMSNGSSFLINTGNHAPVSTAGIYSFASATSTPQRVVAAVNDTFGAQAIALGGGTVKWSDNSSVNLPLWSRSLTNGGSSIALGSATQDVAQTVGALQPDATGFSLSVSGQRTVYTNANGQTYLKTGSSAPITLPGIGGGTVEGATVSGQRVAYYDPAVGDSGAYQLYDALSGATSQLPGVNGNVYGTPEAPPLWGDSWAYVDATGAVKVRNLGTGTDTTVAAAPATASADDLQEVLGSSVAVWGDYVAWTDSKPIQLAGCTPSDAVDCYGGLTYSVKYRDFRDGGPVMSVPFADDSDVASDGAALRISESTLAVAAGFDIYTVPLGGTTAAVTVSNAIPTYVDGSVFDVDGSSIAWVDVTDYLPRVAPLGSSGGVPRFLSDPVAPGSFNPANGTWNGEWDFSKPLPTCTVTITQSSTVVKQLDCATTTGSALASWDGTDASGSPVSSGTYTWTVTGADAVGSAVNVDGTASPITGTVNVTQAVHSSLTATGPCRAFDTRFGSGNCAGAVAVAKAPVGAGSTLKVTVAGVAGIPSNATAVVMNLTAVGATKSTYVTAWPDGSTRPATSTLNVANGNATPNLAVIPIGADGKIDLYNASGSVNLFGDISGYFAPTTGSTLTTAGPCRAFDTRSGSGSCAGAVAVTKAPLGVGSTLKVQVAGVAGVPSNATAVVMNLTAVGATKSTYVTAWPDGTTRPTVSNLNVANANATPNLAVIPIGADGKVDLYNAAGYLNLFGDISGYFAPTTGSTLVTAGPCRAFDTRSGTTPTCTGAVAVTKAPVGAGATLKVTVRGVAGIPSNATAVVINLTAVGATGSTWVAAWPDGTARPAVSTLNVANSNATPNLAIVPIGADGKIDLYNAAGTINLIGDISGYFAP